MGPCLIPEAIVILCLATSWYYRIHENLTNIPVAITRQMCRLPTSYNLSCLSHLLFFTAFRSPRGEDLSLPSLHSRLLRPWLSAPAESLDRAPSGFVTFSCSAAASSAGCDFAPISSPFSSSAPSCRLAFMVASCSSTFWFHWPLSWAANRLCAMGSTGVEATAAGGCTGTAG